MSINWKEIAKLNNMSYEEFGKELLITTIAYMSNEMQRKESNEMIVSNGDLQLICKIIKQD